VISFVAEVEDQQQSRHNSSPEKTDGEQALLKLSAETPQTVDAAHTDLEQLDSPNKLTFCFETIQMQQCSQDLWPTWNFVGMDTIGIHIPISNPSDKILKLNVVLANQSLHGQNTFTLSPRQTFLYELKFSPVVVGTSDENVIFLSDMIEEFWYALKLIVDKPLPTNIPEIECELGKCSRLYIPLFNPTQETLELEFVNSNPSNFSIETDPKHPVIVAPHSTTEVPVQFCPSALGRGNHKASITFSCSQLTEWIFNLSGTGLPPQLMEPTSISACIGQRSSGMISFKNPTPENVVVDVMLTGIRLAPKQKLNIPVLFMPDTMKTYEAVVVIHVMRENGENWPYEDSAELNKDLKSVTVAENGGIKGILWIYPVHGLPEAPQQKLIPTVVRCQARQRVERRVELLLTGVPPGATAMPAARNSAMVNTNKPANIQENIQVPD
ncbi:PREDICTED: putative uncharacterized protein CXorf30 homolog, partial [Nestor notabilis]|uniref:putative uncharacterized protein CXorf30 homolog n=1 Tax=Nestor notabilis TaxID=176057 RepID=UPI000523D910